MERQQATAIKNSRRKTMSDKLIIYTDGGARGNPGPAAVGVAIYNVSGREMERYKKYIGTATNNQAKYKPLIAALELATTMGPESLGCHTDSEPIVTQFQRNYKITDS